MAKLDSCPNKPAFAHRYLEFSRQLESFVYLVTAFAGGYHNVSTVLLVKTRNLYQLLFVDPNDHRHRRPPLASNLDNP
jgi:hypothetical protein